MSPSAPRVAYFPDSFHEVNGVAHTSRHFEAFARRRDSPRASPGTRLRKHGPVCVSFAHGYVRQRSAGSSGQRSANEEFAHVISMILRDPLAHAEMCLRVCMRPMKRSSRHRIGSATTLPGQS